MEINDRLTNMESTDWLAEGLTNKEIGRIKELARISAKLQLKRMEMRMNQTQFAKRLGVSQGMVSKWESGEYNFTISTLTDVCAKLGMEFETEIRNKKSPNEIPVDWKLTESVIRELVIENGTVCLTADADVCKRAAETENGFPIDMKIEDKGILHGRRYGRILMRIAAKVLENEQNAGKIRLLIEGEVETCIELDESSFKKNMAVYGGDMLYTEAKKKIDEVSALTFTDCKVVLPTLHMEKICSENL